MKFKRVKHSKFLEVYYGYDYPYCEFKITSIPSKSTTECTYYYISIKSENTLIYDSIRDDNKIYKGLDETKNAIKEIIFKYRDFSGVIEIDTD